MVVKKVIAGFGFFRKRLYDVPINKLKDHSRPVPYAGTAIFLTFMTVIIGLRFFTHFPSGTLHRLRAIIFGGTIIFLLGLLDDILDLDFKVKFFWQVIAAIILIYYGVCIKFFEVQQLNVAATLFWVVLVSNAVNIIDILDGLAVGVAGIAALAFFCITLPTEQIYVNYASITLFGVLSGFWLFNKPPAKVFMGDAGSLFVGFMLASLSMGADYTGGNILGLFAPVLILGIPLYDTILVSYLRWRSGKPVFKGSKDHYALRLTVAGLSPWKIDILSYSISLLLAVSAFFITFTSLKNALLILMVVFLLSFTGSTIIGRIDIGEQ
ncbi:MraY family glycosyltransferase [Elusimicrobiota bacterium]